MHRSSNRYIITGGSGSGKSSLIRELKSLGYSCYSEISRTVIREQQENAGELLPWENMSGFASECFKRMQAQLQEEPEQPVFFDRGIPDIIAYLQIQDLSIEKDYGSYARHYNPKVFICPPWQDIFVNDPQRPEAFDYSRKIYHLLKEVYEELGFKVLEIPRISVASRADFVLSCIDFDKEAD